MSGPCPASPTFGYPCDPVCERCGQGQPDPLELPAPDGHLNSRLGAWWRLSEDETVRARQGQVDVGFGYEDPDRIERDALAVLAACAWARR